MMMMRMMISKTMLKIITHVQVKLRWQKMIIPYSRLDTQHTTISIEDLIQDLIPDQDHIMESSL
jgi:hypothetical protein